LTAIQAQASWAYGMDVNLLAAGYSSPRVGSAGSGIYAGKEGPLMTIMPSVPTTQMLVTKVFKKTSPQITPVSDAGDPIEATTYRNILSDVHSGNSSQIVMLRDYLEPYETLLLTETEFFSAHTLCHNELCCHFEVAMHGNEVQNSSERGYVYRLAVFDGIRSYTYATGGVQICGIMFCTGNNLSSCGYEMETNEQERFLTVFDYIYVSGNFRLNSTVQLPNTLVQDYGVLSSDTFDFTREEIPGKNEVKVNMRTKRQILNLLTFAIFGRDFLKDGGPVSEPSVDVNSAEGAHLLSPIATLLCLNSYFYVKFLL
jgi:hypothetical protein